ncbi:MAG: hypothetical protein WC444_04510 [Candidatus Paceibacterota bacterium]
MSNHAISGLIEALNIFKKYAINEHGEEKSYVTSAEHDVIYVNVDPENVRDEDKKRLEELGWNPDEGVGFRYYT